MSNENSKLIINISSYVFVCVPFIFFRCLSNPVFPNFRPKVGLMSRFLAECLGMRGCYALKRTILHYNSASKYPYNLCTKFNIFSSHPTEVQTSANLLSFCGVYCFGHSATVSEERREMMTQCYFLHR